MFYNIAHSLVLVLVLVFSISSFVYLPHLILLFIMTKLMQQMLKILHYVVDNTILI